MKKFLCPVDFTDVAFHGIEYAARVAAFTGASVTLCHVQPTIWPEAVFLEGEVEESEHAILEKLNAISEETASSFGIPCTFMMNRTTDTVEGSIAGLSSAFDLVVMGTNGTEDFFEYIFGSHSFNVSRLAQCPVLVIPEGCIQALPSWLVYLHKEKTNPQLDILVPVWWSQLMGAHFAVWLESSGDSAQDEQFRKELLTQVQGDRQDGLVESVRIHPDPSPAHPLPGHMFALALNHRSVAGRKQLRRTVNTCADPMLVFEVQ